MGFEEDLVREMGASNAFFLGEGTFGETWCARDVDGGGVDYAVKVLKPEWFNAKLVQREVDNLGHFDHPGIVKLVEVRTVTIEGEARVALVCEFIEGGSVEAAIKAGDFPTRKQAKKFARGLLEALTELHANDKIHRDIKPANIMLRDGDWSRPVLIDFGLSRSVSGGTMTAYPQRVGSVPWMAPEQLRGERARKAADVWACGVVVYELLSARHPFFYGVSLPALDPEELVDLVAVPPAPLPQDVPEKLAGVVLRLLTADPPNQRGTARRAWVDLGGGR